MAVAATGKRMMLMMMMSNGLSKLSYDQARRLLLAAGLLVLLVTAGVMYVRRVETVEVLATLLFIPVFVALVFWSLKGGLVAGVLAALAYAALRYPAIEAVGADRFVGLIFSRSFAFVAFGAIGGWANSQLAGSLTKLEIYDQIDDPTGLFNARFFVQDTDLEVSRSQRYQTIFSVVEVSFPASGLDQMSRRQKAAVLRDTGKMLKDAVRTVDRSVHASDGIRHRFAVVLPETAREGAVIFRDRLADSLAVFLRERRFHLDEGDLVARSVTFPEDGEEAIGQMREEYRAIDRVEHPEAATASSS